MQQVIENAAVQVRFAAVIGQEGLAGPLAGLVDIVHPPRQLPQLRVVLRHHVGLQVEEDLQAMLQLAEEAVVGFQDHPFLVAQAAGLFQLHDGFQGVAGADGGQIGAVEKLQELDHELDVADAAVAGLYVAHVAPFVVCALFDAAFQGLDAADVGRASNSGDRSRAATGRGIPVPAPGRRPPRGP